MKKKIGITITLFLVLLEITLSILARDLFFLSFLPVTIFIPYMILFYKGIKGKDDNKTKVMKKKIIIIASIICALAITLDIIEINSIVYTLQFIPITVAFTLWIVKTLKVDTEKKELGIKIIIVFGILIIVSLIGMIILRLY